MELVRSDLLYKERLPSIDAAHQVGGRELYRQGIWVGDMTAVTLDVTAFVVQLRCRKHADGSWDVLEVMSRFHTLGKEEFLQSVERMIYRWVRYDLDPDGQIVSSRVAVDYDDNPCEFYQPEIRNSFAAVAPVINELDFHHGFDPQAWE